MSTKRTIIRRGGKGSHRITPFALSLFKEVLQTDDDRKRWPVENQLNLELKRAFDLQSWQIPYRRGLDRYVNDEMLPQQLKKIVAKILAS